MQPLQIWSVRSLIAWPFTKQYNFERSIHVLRPILILSQKQYLEVLFSSLVYCLTLEPFSCILLSHNIEYSSVHQKYIDILSFFSVNPILYSSWYPLLPWVAIWHCDVTCTPFKKVFCKMGLSKQFAVLFLNFKHFLKPQFTLSKNIHDRSFISSYNLV